jgi:uncharacterized protein
MEQRLSIVTLGVNDLACERAFYEGVLGWRPIDDNEQIAFYNVGSLMLALYPNDELADDIDPSGETKNTWPFRNGYRGFTLAYNVGSDLEVDALFVDLKECGVEILKEPHHTDWGGYSGYFADPEGNPWEVANNPFWPNDENGRPITPGG